MSAAATLWDAFEAQLVGGLGSRATVWDSRRPDAAPLPGVVLRSGGGPRQPAKLSGRSTQQVERFWTVSVGEGPDQVRALRRFVVAAVLDARLVVTGLTCGPVHHDDADVTRPDEGEHPRPTVYLGVDEWTVLTTRA